VEFAVLVVRRGEGCPLRERMISWSMVCQCSAKYASFRGFFFGERSSLLSTLCLLFLAKQVVKEQDDSARVIGSGTFASITAFSHQGSLLLCYDRSKREVKHVGYRIFV